LHATVGFHVGFAVGAGVVGAVVGAAVGELVGECVGSLVGAAVVGAAMARTAHLRDKSTVAVRGIVLTNPSVRVATDGGWHDDGASVGSSGTSMSLKLALRIAATSSANLPLS
jgi:hypothetical protein